MREIVDWSKPLDFIAADLRRFVRTAPDGAEKIDAISKLGEVVSEIEFRSGVRKPRPPERDRTAQEREDADEEEVERLIPRLHARRGPDGRIPSSSRKRLLRALANPRGRTRKPDREWFLASAEFNRQLREKRQKARLKSGKKARREREVPSQEILAGRLGTTPKALQRALAKHEARLTGKKVATRMGIRERKAREQQLRELKESDKKTP